MSDYVRVKQADTGHEMTLPVEHVEAADSGSYTVLDKPAVDEGGSPLPPKFKTTVAKAAASKSGQQAATDKEKD